ncbi:unnamed protein product [Toxocara canis]|uniref:ZP domain-containing protein n=1 Tax=Toxocara canis TaxID=6265 RepID=A0A183UQ45_TOXCA|nr:unnamed protein product [Toxocara canis]
MIIRQCALFIVQFVICLYARDQLLSSPFDNFRIECAKASGATRISVHMVGSQGFRRQDIVFGVTCERVDELYPWYGIPMGISDLEREDCYYSQMFDPLVDTDSQFSCRVREYMAGITRLSDTRIQILCCRLRTRDEVNCNERRFGKPMGNDPRTEIFDSNKLINSIAVEGFTYRVRFCDLTPRAIGLIYEDEPSTTTTRTLPTTTEEVIDTELITEQLTTMPSTRTRRTTNSG